MSKFEGPNAPGYLTMSTAIQEWVEDAPDIIEVRWKVEKNERIARTRRELDERRVSYVRLVPYPLSVII